jgi:hypothetical protein
MRSDAIMDFTGIYRYTLWRAWDEALPRLGFIMLNPSTADATRDDPTIRRCIGFARAWHYGAVEVVNLFAYRATDPARLAQVADPVGPDNDHYILQTAEHCAKLVAAWGCQGKLMGRDAAIRRLLKDVTLCCLGLTQDGYPRHPLYLRADAQPVPYER